MAVIEIARNVCRTAKAQGRNSALVGAAAATVTAMTVGLTTPTFLPSASADEVIYTAVTAGPLFGLLDMLGVDSVSTPGGAAPLNDNFTFDVDYTHADAVNLADRINADPLGGWSILSQAFQRQPGGASWANSGYTDVFTPDKLNDCATGCDAGRTPKTYADLGYTAYDRSFMLSGEPTPFLSQAPLTLQEWLHVPGDVVRALIGGFTDEIRQIFGVTPALVSSAPASVNASLTGSPEVQAISPPPDSSSPDPTPVTAPAQATTGVHDQTARATRDSADESSATRDAKKAAPHKTRGSVSDNAGDGNQAKNDSPTGHAAAARSAKPAP